MPTPTRHASKAVYLQFLNQCKTFSTDCIPFLRNLQSSLRPCLALQFYPAMFYCLFSRFGLCAHSARCSATALPGHLSQPLSLPLSFGFRSAWPSNTCSCLRLWPVHMGTAPLCTRFYQDGQSCSSSGLAVSGYPGLGTKLVTRFGAVSPGSALLFGVTPGRSSAADSGG